MRRRMAALRQAMPQSLRIHYAIKANSYRPVLELMAGLVDGFDIASGGELAMVLAAGQDPAKVSFAGPGKRDEELRAAIEKGVTLNLESENEARRALRIAEELGKAPALAIRVNPDFELRGSGMKMGGGAKPFGLDAERVPALAREIIAAGADWRGLHIFTGSQALDAGAIAETQANVLELAARLTREIGQPLPHLNMGGGFGIPYFHGDQPLDIAAVGAALAERFDHLPDELAGTEFAIELGRYLVGEAGVYLTRIVDRKVSHGKTFLVTDGGLHHQLAASGNFGTVVRRNYPVAIASDSLASRSKRSMSSAACAPRSTASPTRPCCRAPTSATSSRCSVPGPMAPAPAPRPSSARDRPRKCWFRIEPLLVPHWDGRSKTRDRAVSGVKTNAIFTLFRDKASRIHGPWSGCEWLHPRLARRKLEDRTMRFSAVSRLLTAFAMALAVVGCASTPDAQLAPASFVAMQEGPGEEYIIGPLDELTIHVWRNDELGAQVQVRPDGRITTPLVTDMPAVGKTPTMLAEDIRLQLSQYIAEPLVSVIVNKFAGTFSQQIRVVGATEKPASIPYRANMTVLDAMIAVGGLSEFAAGNRAKLIRFDKQVGSQREYPLRLGDLLKKGDSKANVMLSPAM